MVAISPGGGGHSDSASVKDIDAADLDGKCRSSDQIPRIYISIKHDDARSRLQRAGTTAVIITHDQASRILSIPSKLG